MKVVGARGNTQPRRAQEQGVQDEMTSENSHIKAPRGQSPMPARARARVRLPALKVPSLPLRAPVVRHSLFISLALILIVTVFALTALVALHLRLRQGPIVIDSLVAPIERAINRELVGIKLRVANAILRYADDGSGLQFRLRDAKLFDDFGRIVATAPFAKVDLSARALLRGLLAAERIELIEPRMLAFYDEARGLSLLPVPSHDNGATATRPPGPSRGQGAPQGRSSSAKARSGAPGAAGPADQRPPPGPALAHALAEALADARRNRGPGSYLEGFVMRDATVIFTIGERQRLWRVPAFTLSVRHRQKRSILEGHGRIAAPTGAWSLKFRAEESQKRNSLSIVSEFANLVPSTLAGQLSSSQALALIRMPVSGRLVTELGRDGEIRRAELSLDLAPGNLALGAPDKGGTMLALEGGALNLRFDRSLGLWKVLESTIRGDNGFITLVGTIKNLGDGGNGPLWALDLRSTAGRIGGRDLGAREPIRSFTLRARWQPIEGRFDLEQLRLFLKDGGLAFAGGYSPWRGLVLGGRLASMPLATFKRLWPRALAGPLRAWFIERVSGGRIVDGTLSLSLADGLSPDSGSEERLRAPKALALTLVGENMRIRYAAGLPPLAARRLRARIEGGRFTLEVPEARVALADRRHAGGAIATRRGVLRIADIFADDPRATIAFEARANAPAALSYLAQGPFPLPRQLLRASSRMSGNVAAQLEIDLPLIRELSLEQLRIRGRATLEDLAVKNLLGDIDLHGGSVQVTLSERTAEARGDVLLNGVPAKLNWLRFAEASRGSQRSARAEPPELRLSATLDDTDREQLGLEVNHIVRGSVPTTLTLAPSGGDKVDVRVRADLSNAEIILENLAWRKPPGQSAMLTFRVVEGKGGRTELRDFKIASTAIAVDGWVALGKDRRFAAFHFPQFTLDVVTQLEISGTLDKNQIWQIEARGRTYDGRPFFRALFSAEKLGRSLLPPEKQRAGMDIIAKINTVIGFSDTNLHDLALKARRRRGRLIAFAAKGRLSGGGEINVYLETDKAGRRYLLADSDNAGDAFRLVGFYRSIKGGKALLRVALGDDGATEKRGLLQAYNFVVLGDPVVREVLNERQTGASASSRERRRGARVRRGREIERTQIQFDKMRIPFSVGQGQFVLRDSSISGPLLGATLRGSVDFVRRRVQLAGTYVPLYGLNSALGVFPIIGQILQGRQGEGLVGITFAIQGDLGNPRVLVNPISLVAPGIFRQIFEYNQPLPRLERRQRGKGRRGPAPRSSSSPATVIPQASTESAWPANGEENWNVRTIR